MDKLPSKYLDKFHEIQKYHKTSDFYASNHSEEELSGYAGISGGSYDREAIIASKNATLITSKSDLDMNDVKKINVKSVGKFNADLGMSFDPRVYQPAQEASNYLISDVSIDKPLITTSQGLQAQIDNVAKVNIQSQYETPKQLDLNNLPKLKQKNEPIKITDDFFIDIDYCIETYPCRHPVSSDGVNFDKNADGASIAKWCLDAGCSIPPHFQEYIDFQDATMDVFDLF